MKKSNSFNNIDLMFLELSVGGLSSSWEGDSEDGGRGFHSDTPTSSCESATGASASDVEAAATIGATESTPYQCAFCHLAFPRLSYLKKHEQVRLIRFLL